MKTWKKVAIGIGGAAVLAIIVSVSIHQANKDVVSVQTGTVKPEDLSSIVTASGEVRPLNYTNVLGQGFGLITDIVVKEGDHVKKGALLVTVDNVQPRADVDAQSANLQSAQAGITAAEANNTSAQADVQQSTAAFQKAKLDWERGQQLFDQGLIAKQDFDTYKSSYDQAVANLAASKARAQQAQAQLEQSRSSLTQNQATLRHQRDVLQKTTYTAPIDGVVSYIAVRVGEYVVPGIQSSQGSYLMTISDMSVVTAEVMVDETDIVNVRPNQVADVTIDAIPNKIFKGHVTQVGTQAVLRTSGLATTQSTTSNQEAKDFKVVVTLDHPPDGLRPGLSTTAKVTTEQKQNVLAIPIQALAVRTRHDIEEAEKKGGDQGTVTLAASRPAADSSSDSSGDPEKQDVQGVFVVRNKHAIFVPVETGITGVTDIEVLTGLQNGDQIVTGSYKALRTIKPGTSVKVDNSAPKVPDENQS
jgi:HlyD family secretion protein